MKNKKVIFEKSKLSLLQMTELLYFAKHASQHAFIIADCVALSTSVKSSGISDF